VLKDDLFNPGVLLGGGFAAPAPVPAVAESGDGLIAFQQGDPSGARSVVARPYDYVPASRLVTQPGPPAVLSDPALGQTDASRGLEAAADRAGRHRRRLRPGRRPPGARSSRPASTAPRQLPAQHVDEVAQVRAPPLKWGTAFELWGPLTYQVLIDNKPVAQTTSTGVTVPVVIPDGLHRWRVVATDIRGQSTATPSRTLRVDATPPKVTYKISGARQRGKPVKVVVQASDASGTAAQASGSTTCASPSATARGPIVGLRAIHRYGHSGKVTVRISAVDKAGNVAAKTRQITIHK
jgi:hypothetical protein